MSRANSGKAVHSKFQNTLWSDVLRAGNANSPEGWAALERLCQLYWYPIYVFIRRCGYDHHAATDLTQGFFEYFLGKELIQKADPANGRFRSFLLGTLKNYLSNETQRAQAVKRGGGAVKLSIDADSAEERYTAEPATLVTPEVLFDRKWAIEVIGHAAEKLDGDYRRAGMSDIFAALSPFLTNDQNVSYTELAARLGKNEGAVRTAVSRMRTRFREIIREIIAQTLSQEGTVDEEMNYLKSVLRGN